MQNSPLSFILFFSFISLSFSLFSLKMKFYQTKKQDHYSTPAELFERLDNEFHFNHDPCPLHGEEYVDGLLSEWGSSNFVNPPYSCTQRWVEKCVQEQKKGKLVVLLIPAHTSTYYFHDFIIPNAEIRFFKGRIKFEEEGKTRFNAAPFGSMLCIFHPKSDQ